MNELTSMFHRWWVALIFGIGAIILGIVMLMNPIASYIGMSYAFAFYFIAYGVYKAVMTYKERDLIPAWGWSFALGIITAVLGVMLLLPGMAAGTFVYYVTFCVLFMGINECAASFSLKDQGDKGWGWTLALGILTIVLSFFMLMAPVFSMDLVSIWGGILFIVLGIQLCMLSYRLSVANSIAKRGGAEVHHA